MKYEYYTGGRIYIQKGSGDLFYCARVDGSLRLYEKRDFYNHTDYDGRSVYGRPVHRSLIHIGTLSLKTMGFHKEVTPYV